MVHDAVCTTAVHGDVIFNVARPSVATGAEETGGDVAGRACGGVPGEGAEDQFFVVVREAGYCVWDGGEVGVCAGGAGGAAS